MDILTLQNQFKQIGAILDVDIQGDRQWHSRRRFWSVTDVNFLLDVDESGKQDRFTLTARESKLDEFELRVVDTRPKDRHLLLMAKEFDPAGRPQKDKFLCGHDERHWFVAGVPNAQSVANVFQAKEALKPNGVARLQRLAGVKRKNWQKRKNAGFLRQGEWFFLPQPQFMPSREALIFSWEPITRSGGKPHMVEQLCRFGGETVYVCSRYPNGVTAAQYRRICDRNHKANRWNWRTGGLVRTWSSSIASRRFRKSKMSRPSFLVK